MYIVSNIDSYSEASALGIKASNTANYKKTKDGTRSLFKAVASASEMMYECGKVSGTWKEELE